MTRIGFTATVAGVFAASVLGAGWFSRGFAEAASEPAGAPAPPSGIGHPSFLSPHARPIAVGGGLVFVVNTPADTVDVIDTKSRRVVRRIPVGVDPVGIAVRPDGREAWVANHLSDSVSVIDTVEDSPTFLRVVATVQDLDLEKKVTRFDEPVGVAFAGNDKAYVALSSENRIAVVNVETREVEKHLKISAQDPRAIVVRGGRLYVIPFESNNQTQLSGGDEIDGELVTFNAHEHSIANNNVLSLGHVTDIVKHPRVPDRDLYVFDTATDRLVQTVDTLGTLLYGLAVDSKGRVFIAQADARNEVNGRSGTKQHGLKELENRAFLNQITRVEPDGDRLGESSRIELEPLPPRHPEPGAALATPFAIQVSADDSTLVVSAAASDMLFTVDADSGEVLGRAKVGAVPRGIALQSGKEGKPARAWVLNAVGNSVSLVDLSDPAAPSVGATIPLEDPTHPAFKRGRIAFESALASSTGTFACASCHPDGHTDQLLWVLETPVVTGGEQIMPRSTMPVRGLRDTAPFHWDGIPGDPYGGINSASIRSHVEPNSSADEPESATRHLVDGALATTMAIVGGEGENDEGKAGRLSAAERDDLAKFLLGVTYPPAPKRAWSNALSARAERGFELFHIIGDKGNTTGAGLCGNCHRMPFWVSTNTPGTGMDAPTWRGAQDRFLILPQGRLNIIDFDFYRRVAEGGNDERSIWQFSWAGRRAFDPVWEMVLEGSTGFSGAFARQLTLSEATAGEALTGDLLDALEKSAAEGAVVLQVEGVFRTGDAPRATVMQFDAKHQGGSYVEVENDRRAHPREELVDFAAEGRFVGTFTGRHGAKAGYDHPQPALWTLSPLHAQSGRQEFPVVHGENRTMTINARHLREGANLIVDGRRVEGSIRPGENEKVKITLRELPEVGMHFLQVQNPDGLFSNDFIFHAAADAGTALAADPDHLRDALDRAISRGDLAATRRLIEAGAPVNERKADGGTPLSTAAFHGHMDIAEHLLASGARINNSNRDGNTPLHVAAFLCREEMVELFLEKGAAVLRRNNRRETPIDAVSGRWTEELAGFYGILDQAGGLGLDLDEIERMRPEMAALLRGHAARSE